MAKLKSQSQKYVELKEEDYLLLIENTIKMEALKIAGKPSPVAVIMASTFSDGISFRHSSPQATPILIMRLMRLRRLALVIISL